MYRAVSFWIDWQFLDWPGEHVREKIIRRCDEMAAANVNMAVVFGTHFRWDFLPIMARVHDVMAFIAEELHKRNIQFFDHHSSVLTHRIRKPEDREHIRRYNYHHLPFYPDTDFVQQMTYNGTYLNDWRMIDVETGLPIFINVYNCEQFCMNNPMFREAYQVYLRRLLKEVPLDGLMSDDGIYYAGWHACGCQYCREKFAGIYGHTLPPVSDSSFWFNRDNPVFIDWIDFRYRSTGEFLSMVKDIVGDLPLMTCCSNSSGQACNAYSTSYEEFASFTSLAMLEVSGRGITPAGKWTDLFFARAMLQMAIARRYGQKHCLVLGYGFTKDSFELFWQITRFLGADNWLSPLKGRLVPKSTWSLIDSLPEEQQLAGEFFTWEKEHEDLFEGESDARVGVYFSRDTRDHFARSWLDFEAVYKAVCEDLIDGRITFNVVCDIKDIFSYSVIALPAAVCLSEQERNSFRKYLKDGGTMIAVGPIGLRDSKGRPTGEFMLEFGIEIEIKYPALAAGYQADEDVYSLPSISCSGKHNGTRIDKNKWIRIDMGEGILYWTPSLDSSDHKTTNISDIINDTNPEPVVVISGLEKWYLRRYRKGNRLILLGLNSNITPIFNKELSLSFGQQPILEKLIYDSPCHNLLLKSKEKITSAKLFTLENPEPYCAEITGNGTEINFAFDEISKFFVIEMLIQQEEIQK